MTNKQGLGIAVGISHDHVSIDCKTGILAYNVTGSFLVFVHDRFRLVYEGLYTNRHCFGVPK